MNLDLTRYRTLLHQHVGPDAALVLKDARTAAALEGGGQLRERVFANGAGEAKALCTVILPDRADPAAEEFAETLLDCVHQEWRLVLELDQMALELGQRYDELNLLFHSADENTEANDSHAALTTLAEAFADHVGVLGAMILFPEQNVVALACSDGVADRRKELIEVTTLFWTLVASHRRPLIVNTAEERAQTLPSLNVKVAAAPVLVDSRPRGLVCLLRDLSDDDFAASDRNLIEVVAQRASTTFLLSYDMLTGLRNRRTFESMLETAVERCPDAPHYLLNVDVDQLRMVNDAHGHEVGDEVLKFVGSRLKRRLGNEALLGRTGSDAFAIHWVGGSLQQVVALADSLRESIGRAKPVVRGTALDVTVSIGVAVFRPPALASRGMDAAETAMRDAKEAGRNRVRAYDEQHAAVRKRQDDIHWVNMVRQALVEDRFTLFAQPITPADEPHRTAHFEVLLRLQGEQDQLIAPFFFMPVAERYMLMPDIDRWVLAKTLAMLSASPRQDVGWTINLSGQSLRDPDFQTFLLEAVASTTIPGDLLGFEITETSALGDLQIAREFVESVQRLGCRVLLDDFGTGVASFDYLKTLPIDVLKIDGIFIKDLLENPVSESMVRAINEVAHVMNIRTVAEFVETPAIIERLREIGIDYLQGYGIGKPVPLADVLRGMA